MNNECLTDPDVLSEQFQSVNPITDFESTYMPVPDNTRMQDAQNIRSLFMVGYYGVSNY